MDCPHHEAIVNELANMKTDKRELWDAVKELSNEIKNLTWKLAIIVGGISALNPIIDILKK